MDRDKYGDEDKTENNIIIASPDSVKTSALANAKNRHDSAVIEDAMKVAERYMYKPKVKKVQAGDTLLKADTVHTSDSVQLSSYHS